MHIAVCTASVVSSIMFTELIFLDCIKSIQTNQCYLLSILPKIVKWRLFFYIGSFSHLLYFGLVLIFLPGFHSPPYAGAVAPQNLYLLPSGYCFRQSKHDIFGFHCLPSVPLMEWFGVSVYKVRQREVF